MNIFNQANSIPMQEIAIKLGVEFNALNNFRCNFHEDNNPSASYWKVKNKYHCFSCNVNLSNIDIVMKVLNMNRLEAVDFILQNNTYNDIDKSIVKINNKKRKCLTTDIINIYTWFYDNITIELPVKIKEHFHNTRNLSYDVLTKDYIAYINIDSWKIKDQLIEKFGLDELLKSGLISISKKGKPYPIFINYPVVFPHFAIESEKRIVKYLKFRSLNPNIKPKEKNLFNVPIWFPYGVDKLKDNDSKAILLCEGNMDYLAAKSYSKSYRPIGLPSTSLKKEWLDLFTNEDVVIGFDHDKGIDDEDQISKTQIYYKKIHHINEILKPFAKSISYLEMPIGIDLNNYLKEFKA